eukprot:gene2660-17126_t
MFTQFHYAATASALEECSRELFTQCSTASKPTLLKRGAGGGVVRREAFVQLVARVKSFSNIEGNQLSAEQLADRVFGSFGGSFTNRLLARNKLSLSKFHDAISRLLRLAAVDPLEFIHLHRTGCFKAMEASRTTASTVTVLRVTLSALNSQDGPGSSSQMDTSTSSQMETSTSSPMGTEFMEDEDFLVCTADEYESSPDHILFEVSVQYPERDLTISALRVQFEVAHSTPSFLKAQACDMIRNLMSAQFPTTSAI